MISTKDYRLATNRAIESFITKNVGTAKIVDKDNFSALDGITCYTVEVWEECMRLPHWHPNASELGYVISGTIEVIIWRSPGESAVFTLSAGMCWFIPQAALHSLNNIGKGHAKLLVGFSSHRPQDIDLPVALNGIPAPIRDVYCSPHTELRKWQGVKSNPLFGKFPNLKALSSVRTASPYGFDFAKVTPLFEDINLGSVVWGILDNWPILKNISILRARLESNVARDPIWYPDAGTLYVVSAGRAQFHIIIADYDPQPFVVERGDYIFVPAGVLHTFINEQKEKFEVIAFFTNDNPQPEVSLSVATGFFPNVIRQAAMINYGNEKKRGDPLKNLHGLNTSPYLLKI